MEEFSAPWAGKRGGGRDLSLKERAPEKETQRRRNDQSGSKSNTAAGTIQIKWACQNSWQLGRKNEDCSKSVSSIDSGAIFPPSLGQDLSGNVVGVSVYAL